MAVPKGQGAAGLAARGESGWADAGPWRSRRSHASLRASPAHPTAGLGTVITPPPPCRDAWQRPCQGRGQQAALPLHCPRDAGGTRGGYCTARSHHCARDVPQAGTDPTPSVSLPRYVPGEPPRGPSPPGRRQQGHDRGHPVRPALQIGAEIPRGTPAAPPHGSPGGHHRHPETHGTVGSVTAHSSLQLARPAAPAQGDGTGWGRQHTGKLRGVAMAAAAPK